MRLKLKSLFRAVYNQIYLTPLSWRAHLPRTKALFERREPNPKDVEPTLDWQVNPMEITIDYG